MKLTLAALQVMNDRLNLNNETNPIVEVTIKGTAVLNTNKTGGVIKTKGMNLEFTKKIKESVFSETFTINIETGDVKANLLF